MNPRAFLLGGLVASLTLLNCSAVHAQDNDLPHLLHRDGHHALIVDGKPFLMIGAQIHNSSAWPAVLPQVWPSLTALHVNTVEAPIYWEQLEPEQGRFDYTCLDALLAGAREQKLRMVLLWFGTFKNGSAHYIPTWMKLQPEKYPNALNPKGKFVDSPSVVTEATLQADMKAFTALMTHLKQADPQHTVILVQVENEVGCWDNVRDCSPTAEKLFQSAVPAEALKAMNKTDAPAGANWATAFGRDADEYFQVWTTAHFVGQVAAAGKAIYPLPMYVNSSPRDPLHVSYPPHYQVGAPNDNVIPLWQAAAPAIDVQCPDIYSRDEAHYEKYFECFTQANNPLLIVETVPRGSATRFFYSALNHGAIGYAPFGVDDAELLPQAMADARPYETAANFAAVAPMAGEIARLNFEGKLQAAVESDEPKAASPATQDSTRATTPDRVFHFGNWDVLAHFGRFNRRQPTTRPAGGEHMGRIMAAELSPGEFLITGLLTRLDFKPTGDLAGKPWQYLKVEEGQYENGQFIARRILNGDETDWGLHLIDQPVALRVKVYTR